MSKALFEKRDALMGELANLTDDDVRRRTEIEAECRSIDARIRGYFDATDGADRRASAAPSLGAAFVEARGDELTELRNRGGGATVTGPEFKAATDTVTTGPEANNPLSPLLTDVDPTIVRVKRERPVIADLLGSGSVAGNAVSYFVESAAEGDFATVAEGAKKPQMFFANPTAVIDPVRKIAGWTKVTDEFLEDLPALKSEIDERLIYKLRMVEEAQLLRGDGVGTNITGLLNRDGVQIETAANAADLADAIFRATTKIATATDLTADGLVIHPKDYEALRLTKDGNGQYFGGGFFQGSYGNGGLLDTPPVWGLPTVVSPAVEQGKPLVGAFRLGATVHRKGGIQVAATNSNEDDFITNKVTLRVEERLALAVRVPTAFVKVELAGAGV